MTLLLLKVLVAPGFVVAATLVSRRFGVAVAGIVSGSPVTAGPILLVFALEHGSTFARHAAIGTVLGVVALIVFVLAFAWAAERRRWPWAVAAGWGSFAVVIAALRPVHVGPLTAFVVAGAACGCGLALLRRSVAPVAQPPAYPPFDLVLRGACVVLPVVCVTAAAHLLGAQLSGLVASFPVITPVLAAFTLAHRGPAESIRLLRGMTVGFFAYALFGFTVAIGIERLGTATTFVLATAAALVAQTAVLVLGRTRRAEAHDPALDERFLERVAAGIALNKTPGR